MPTPHRRTKNILPSKKLIILPKVERLQIFFRGLALSKPNGITVDRQKNDLTFNCYWFINLMNVQSVLDYLRILIQI